MYKPPVFQTSRGLVVVIGAEDFGIPFAERLLKLGGIWHGTGGCRMCSDVVPINVDVDPSMRPCLRVFHSLKCLMFWNPSWILKSTCP